MTVRAFRSQHRSELVTQIAPQQLTRAQLGLIYLVGSAAFHDPPPPMPPEDAFYVGVDVGVGGAYEEWRGGRRQRHVQYARGDARIVDMSDRPEVRALSSHESVIMMISRAASTALCEEHGVIPPGGFACGPSEPDPVLAALSLALKPSLQMPDSANRLFVDQVTLAAHVHILERYGGVRLTRLSRGSLSPIQRRTVLDLIDAHVAGGISLDQMAAECGLSRTQFVAAFARSMGMSPHRWIVARRLERSREMLRSNELSIAQVALACGFGDQSHFTRAFRQRYGITPANWRRTSG
ncbi:helix-turn-helix domain-containing protein [Sphingomonas oleivorans]|nr:AraC family transcriptional regulator [Sphingomonas oleivorans]